MDAVEDVVFVDVGDDDATWKKALSPGWSGFLRVVLLDILILFFRKAQAWNGLRVWRGSTSVSKRLCP